MTLWLQTSALIQPRTSRQSLLPLKVQLAKISEAAADLLRSLGIRGLHGEGVREEPRASDLARNAAAPA